MLRDYASEVQHWRRLTKFARIAGVAFILVGIVCATEGLYVAWYPETPQAVRDVRAQPPEPRAALAVGAVAILIGIGLIWVRAYRPDLGDRNVLDRAIDPFNTFGERKPPYRGPRSWWTGDPRRR